ncbi:MAG: DUF2975 domain-containing protein [Lachnospiraceae bacterium]|jgi:hypothetical protein|nr:DUF2975 domain-containing protein [Lachnospiraceae bacterium]
MEEIIMEESKLKVRRKKVRIMQSLTFFLVMIMMFSLQDFFRDLTSKDATYEIRYEMPFGVTNGQHVYELFKNGEHVCDVDYNEFNLLDENGNQDIWYCLMIQDVRNLCYMVILSIMLIIVIIIVNDTIDGSPFNRPNVKRIRLIGALQIALAVVPGLVTIVMKFFKFEYASIQFQWTGFYMFIIAFAIMMLAQVFDYGVKLQEDVDSIA